MKQLAPQKTLPYSLLTSMYSNWQQYQIPAIYYHYLLSVLPKQDKKKQMLLMAREVKQLKANTHPYHNICNNIEARHRSLDFVRTGLGVLMEYESTSDMEWPVGAPPNNIDMQFDVQSGSATTNPTSSSPYKIKHQDPSSPILSPSLKQPKTTSKQTKLQQLINHLRIYQRVTMQIVLLIAQWEAELKELGYNQSVITFQYSKEDYLQIVNQDTIDILDSYQMIFENNPFLIMKKIHERTQFALVYKELKLSQQLSEKIHQCLNIIANHQADILRYRMLAKVSQTGNRRKLITKSTDIDKIYKNYNNGKDYIIVKDAEAMKKSKILEEPTLSRIQPYQKDKDKKIKQIKNSIIVNPEARLLTIDRTVRKHPVQANMLNLIQDAKSNQNNLYGYHRKILNNGPASSPFQQQNTMPVYLKNMGQSSKDSNMRGNLMTPKRNKSQRILPDTHPSLNTAKQKNPYNSAITDPSIFYPANGLKRSQTLDNIQQQTLKKHASMMLSDSEAINNKYKINSSQSNFQKRVPVQVQIKPVHGQNNIVVKDKDYKESMNRDDYLQKNKGYSIQRNLQMQDKVNSQLKLKNKSHQQQRQQVIKRQKDEPAFFTQKQPNSPKKQKKPQQPQNNQNGQPPGQLPQDSQISLNFQQSIKPTQVVKYLRSKVFNTTPEIQFQQIQSIAKKLLAEKDTITFIRVQCRNMKVAWLAVKFLEKDNTMRRCVFVLYVRKFVRLSGFQRKLLDCFVGHGYGLIKNEQRVLYEVELLDVVVRPLVKIKYKVNPTVEKTQIKSLMKKYNSLGQSRILKYHSYSKSSKYHNYCSHDKAFCSISYNFLQISKISLEKNHYIQAKADRISKLGQNMYRVTCSVNETDLVVANTLTDILSLQKQTQIQKDSSFDSKCQTTYKYLAIRQGKVMRKYVNDANDAVICQFVTVNGTIPEVRSIAITKEDIRESVLIFDPPFFMAIMTKDVGESKTLAVLEFQ